MNKQRAPLFERLQKGMNEALQHARGELELPTREVNTPWPPGEYNPDRIRELRRRLNLSQSGLARVLIVKPKTVQSWEQGTRPPSGAVCRLLQLFDNRPSLVEEILQGHA